MKLKIKILFIVVFSLVISCGGPSSSNDWDNNSYGNRNVSSAYNNFEKCMKMANNNYNSCSNSSHVTVVKDNSGNEFFKFLGEYYLISSIMNGSSHSYVSNGYYPRLGSTYPTSSYITNYTTKNYYYSPRTKTITRKRIRTNSRSSSSRSYNSGSSKSRNYNSNRASSYRTRSYNSGSSSFRSSGSSFRSSSFRSR